MVSPHGDGRCAVTNCEGWFSRVKACMPDRAPSGTAVVTVVFHCRHLTDGTPKFEEAAMGESSDDKSNRDRTEKASTLWRVEAVVNSRWFKVANGLVTLARFAQKAYEVISPLFN